jgi:transcriptional regulator with XRE-family HTH domain
MTFGEKLKSLREKCGMTQHALAEASGVHRVQIARYETGDGVPTWELVQKLARSLGTDCRAFADDPTPAKPKKPVKGKSK